MKTILLVGLGNPGKEFIKTRHNAGFLFLDYIFDKYKEEQNLSWNNSSKFEANTVDIHLTSIKLVLCKPLTFMNDSGRSVRKVMDWYNIKTSGLVIIHDDLDLKLGEFKVQKKGPKVHNGLNSIIENIKEEDFIRIRIGIDNRTDRLIAGRDYVLGKFQKEELSMLYETFPEISMKLKQFMN